MAEQWPDPASPAPGHPTKFCFACGAVLDARAELCPNCGVRQMPSPDSVSTGKDRVTAIVFALLLGGLGVHKFYLGKIALGVIYVIFSWTGIPSLIGLIEGIQYLRTSDAAWAATYGGPVRPANATAIGCLWAIAIVPLALAVLAIISIVSLIFLGGQISKIQ